jgi:hypothetical protein
MLCNAPNYDSDASYCGAPNATGAQIGEACEASSGCLSGYCSPLLGACSLACRADSDCGDGARCGTVTGTYLNVCLRTCASDADCGSLPRASMCVGSYEAGMLVTRCNLPAGPVAFGEPTDDQMPCASFLYEPGPSGDQLCTRPCTSDADCAAPFAACGTGTFPGSDPSAPEVMIHVCGPGS